MDCIDQRAHRSDSTPSSILIKITGCNEVFVQCSGAQTISNLVCMMFNTINEDIIDVEIDILFSEYDTNIIMEYKSHCPEDSSLTLLSNKGDYCKTQVLNPGTGVGLLIMMLDDFMISGCDDLDAQW